LTPSTRAVVVAEWYPAPGDPVHGLWAHRQAVATAAEGVETVVLALRRPVPPVSVARRVLAFPPDAGALASWGRDAVRSLRASELDGLRVEPVPWVGPPRPMSYGSWGYWMAPTLARALARLHSAWPFDVVHAHNLAPTGHAAALWMARGRSRGERRPVLPAFAVSAHGPDMWDVPQRSAVGRRAVRAALDTADLVIANSRWAQTRCEELAGHPLVCEVVHLGADVPNTKGTSAPVRERSELALVTIAHLQARKHHATVLRAMARLAPGIRPTYLVIGDGEERPALERLASELGLRDRVSFTGQLENEQALRRLGECDLFVMPGVHEPFGVAFVEAMAAGLPAIGGRGEGGPQDISAAGEGMLLVDPGDVGQLAETLGMLHRDRDELRRLGAAARETVARNFTWDVCGMRTAEAYRVAIVNRDARR
jgi:teichuronic acid biosynthesis glycosyltransferase TuaC